METQRGVSHNGHQQQSWPHLIEKLIKYRHSVKSDGGACRVIMSISSVGRDSRIVRQHGKRKMTSGISGTKLRSSKSILDEDVKSFSEGECQN